MAPHEREGIQQRLRPAAVRPVKDAAEALKKWLPPGRVVVAHALAERIYVVVVDADKTVARAYERHDARKRAEGDTSVEPVTKLAVAVHYYMRTRRRLIDAAGESVLKRGTDDEVALLARLYRH